MLRCSSEPKVRVSQNWESEGDQIFDWVRVCSHCCFANRADSVPHSGYNLDGCPVATLAYGHCSANSQMSNLYWLQWSIKPSERKSRSPSLVNDSKSIEDAWKRLAKLDHKFDNDDFEIGRFIGFVEGRLGVHLPNGFVHKVLEKQTGQIACKQRRTTRVISHKDNLMEKQNPPGLTVLAEQIRA